MEQSSQDCGRTVETQGTPTTGSDPETHHGLKTNDLTRYPDYRLRSARDSVAFVTVVAKGVRGWPRSTRRSSQRLNQLLHVVLCGNARLSQLLHRPGELGGPEEDRPHELPVHP